MVVADGISDHLDLELVARGVLAEGAVVTRALDFRALLVDVEVAIITATQPKVLLLIVSPGVLVAQTCGGRDATAQTAGYK